MAYKTEINMQNRTAVSPLSGAWIDHRARYDARSMSIRKLTQSMQHGVERMIDEN
jgi:hypothetical protein